MADGSGSGTVVTTSTKGVAVASGVAVDVAVGSGTVVTTITRGVGDSIG